MSGGLTEEILKRVSRIPRTHDVLSYVVGVLLADRGRQGFNPFDGVDVERVMTALELLGRRRDLEVSPFVSAWDAQIELLDRRLVGPRDARDAVAGHLDPIRSRTAGFALISLIERVARGEGDGEAYAQALEDSTSSLVEILGQHGETSYLSPIFEVAERQRGCVVATLNYDRTVESEGERTGRAVDTGLSRRNETGIWEWRADADVRLLKLHGSIDWETVTDSSGPLKQTSARPDAIGHAKPALIFGGANKLRADGPFLELLAQFEALLAGVNDLVVVGYSFRDDHINEIVRRWVNRSVDGRIVVVDPSWTVDLEPSFRKELEMGLLGRVTVADRKPETVLRSRASRLFPITEPAAQGLALAVIALRPESAPVWDPPDPSGRMRQIDEMRDRLSTILNSSADH